MKTRTQKIHASTGISIIETIIAMAILAIVVLGVLNFRYHSSKESWRANVEITAARIGSLMLESWKGAGGSSDWDPVEQMSSLSNIETSALGPAIPGDMNVKGIFRMNEIGTFLADTWNVDYYITLAYNDATETEPKILNASVGWVHQGRAWIPSETEIPVRLTAYVQ